MAVERVGKGGGEGGEGRRGGCLRGVTYRYVGGVLVRDEVIERGRC